MTTRGHYRIIHEGSDWSRALAAAQALASQCKPEHTIYTIRTWRKTGRVGSLENLAPSLVGGRLTELRYAVTTSDPDAACRILLEEEHVWLILTEQRLVLRWWGDRRVRPLEIFIGLPPEVLGDARVFESWVIERLAHYKGIGLIPDRIETPELLRKCLDHLDPLLRGEVDGEAPVLEGHVAEELVDAGLTRAEMVGYLTRLSLRLPIPTDPGRALSGLWPPERPVRVIGGPARQALDRGLDLKLCSRLSTIGEVEFEVEAMLVDSAVESVCASAGSDRAEVRWLRWLGSGACVALDLELNGGRFGEDRPGESNLSLRVDRTRSPRAVAERLCRAAGVRLEKRGAR